MFKLSSRLNAKEREQAKRCSPLLNEFLSTYNLWFHLSSQMEEYLVLENAFSDVEPETRILAHTPNLEDALSYAMTGYSPSFSTLNERRRIIRGPVPHLIEKSGKIPIDAYVISFPPFDVVFCGRKIN